MQKLLPLSTLACSGAARWLLVLCLIGIPWLFGGSRDWTVHWLVVALYAASGLWLLSRFGHYLGRDRSSPWAVSPTLALVCLLASLWGWSMTWNAKSYLDSYLLR